MKPKAKPRVKRPLSAEELQKREAFFALYRDMSPRRTHKRLIEMARPTLGPISERTLVNWSQQHNWRARLAEHDRRLQASPPQPDELDPNFNRVEALERIADLALQRALASHVEVRTPQDFKTMIDAAEKALTLCEKLRQMGKAGHSSQQAAAEGRTRVQRMFDYIDEMVRAKHAAAGNPVGELILSNESEEVDAEAPPTETDEAATVH